MVAVLDRVAVNTECAHSEERLLLGDVWRYGLWASGHNVLINQSVHNLVSYVFQFKDTIFYT